VVEERQIKPFSTTSEKLVAYGMLST